MTPTVTANFQLVMKPHPNSHHHDDILLGVSATPDGPCQGFFFCPFMHLLGRMSSAPARPILSRDSFLRQVCETSQTLAEQLGLDASFLPVVVSLVGALILITFFITLLVWLRYLVTAGLITTCLVAGIRWNRQEVRGHTTGDVHRVIGDDGRGLEIEEPD